jgi:glycosyltransferase involved in cell wall biosynthesis
MKTVVIIGPLPPPVHGVTVAIRRVLDSGLRDRFRLVHLDTSDHRDPSTIGSTDFWNCWYALKSYVMLFLHCLRYRPSVVYVPISQSWVGYFRDSFYFAIARIFSPARVVVHLHGGHFGRFYETGSRLTKRYVDATMRLVSRAIVLGDVFTPIFARWLPKERIDIVPNGTDCVPADVKGKLGRRDFGIVNVTYLSSLMRTKGIVEFVRAAVLCVEEMPELRFHIAGEWWNEDPTVREDTLACIMERHRDRIRFLGLVTGEAKDRLFVSTDLFVLPTYYPFEGQPTVLLEAMAAGCPVISTPHAAIPETVADGVTGILVPPRSPERLAEAILSLARDPEKARAMGFAAYRRYLERYTSEKSNDLLLASLRAAATV